ncbi:uncharacterized protein isoform X2 [Musca autumnalis]|uniref:uncharacterized protein isoform X2 n=1 Tax=Musca autumnalis TaxID=221902 RepID=UPI003CEA7066
MENCSLNMDPCSSSQISPIGKETEGKNMFDISNVSEQQLHSASLQSIPSYVCRICHNCENPEKLVSPCLCRGSLTYVHIHCLERWISMSRCTSCELCQFQYNTQQTLRYSFWESLRIWYSRSMSRRALQEDCQMFSLLTLVAFGIIGTLLVAVQYYILQGPLSDMVRLWSKGWLIFFLFATLAVYLVNVYVIAKSHLTPWYRWWQSARDIRLILENRLPYPYIMTHGHMAKQPHAEQNQQSTQQSLTQAKPIEGEQTTTTRLGPTSNDTSTTACPNNFAQSRPQDIDYKQTSNTVSLTTTTTTTCAVANVCNFLPFSNVITTAAFIVLPINPSSCIAATLGDDGGVVIGRQNVLVAPYTNGCNVDDDDAIVAATPLVKRCNKNLSLQSLSMRLEDEKCEQLVSDRDFKLLTISNSTTNTA